jgi:hypothetical protein
MNETHIHLHLHRHHRARTNLRFLFPEEREGKICLVVVNSKMLSNPRDKHTNIQRPGDMYK